MELQDIQGFSKKMYTNLPELTAHQENPRWNKLDWNGDSLHIYAECWIRQWISIGWFPLFIIARVT